jgi:hypothetical protein
LLTTSHLSTHHRQINADRLFRTIDIQAPLQIFTQYWLHYIEVAGPGKVEMITAVVVVVLVSNTTVEDWQVDAPYVFNDEGVTIAGSPVATSLPDVAMSIVVGGGGDTPVTQEHAEETADGSIGSTGPAGWILHMDM